MSEHRSTRPTAYCADDRETAVTIYWLKRELGRRDYGDKRLVSYIALLIEECGFPPPLPALKTGRRARGKVDAPAVPDSLHRAVTLESRWRREAVEAWFEDYLPPTNAALVDERARRLAATDMDRAATGLRLVGAHRS